MSQKEKYSQYLHQIKRNKIAQGQDWIAADVQLDGFVVCRGSQPVNNLDLNSGNNNLCAVEILIEDGTVKSYVGVRNQSLVELAPSSVLFLNDFQTYGIVVSKRNLSTGETSRIEDIEWMDDVDNSDMINRM